MFGLVHPNYNYFVTLNFCKTCVSANVYYESKVVRITKSVDVITVFRYIT